MKIAVTCETTVDLPKELLDKFDIKVVPFSLMLGDETKLDGEITTDEIIDYVNKTKKLPKTCAINEYQYEEFFSSVLKEYDGIIHFSLSSEISSTCNNAIKASSKLDNVFVIDTRSLSTGIALQAIYARKLIDEGKSIKEVFDLCMERVPFVQASFELTRLDYLYKGGRCSALSLFGANLLKIRPQIILSNGKMEVAKKFRGSVDFVIKNYVEDILKTYDHPDKENVFITYTTASQIIIDWVYNRLKEEGFKNIYITRANGTITCHCGEDCLGILYINDKQ